MDRMKSKVILNQLLQPMSEDAQQAVNGGVLCSQAQSEYKYISVRRY